MITKVPLEHARDGRLGKADKRTLVRIEAKAGLYQTRVRDLDEVILILTPMQELPRQLLGQPEVGSDHLVKDLLPSERPRRLGLEE
jgi:hypothetical protein